MKQFEKLIALILALLLAMCLCACDQSDQGMEDGNNNGTTGDPTNSSQDDTTVGSTEASIPDGMVQYKVKVVDEEGNPIVGVMVQVCTDETCLIPVKTDDAGIATFAPAAEGEYHANFLPNVPAGYEADAEVFYFAEGETELTIVLKTASDSGAN